MERCPVCRAKPKGKTTCSRCRAELSPLYAIEKQADHMLARSVACLGNGDIFQARRFCVHAQNLKQTPFGTALKGFIDSYRNL